MRLLWVENHSGFATVVGRQFLATHELTLVPSVAAAKAALAARIFDAVLVDYDLDDGKGTAIVDFIRRFPNRMAVIAASAHDEGNAMLLAAGADAACPKLRFADIESVLMSVVVEPASS